LAWIRKDADTGSASGRRTFSALQWTHNQTLFREVEEGMAFSMYFPSGLVAQASTCCSAALSSTLYIEGTPGSVIRGGPLPPSGGAEGYIDMAIIEALYRSAEAGVPQGVEFGS
jgi:predicted dehydrogenase